MALGPALLTPLNQTLACMAPGVPTVSIFRPKSSPQNLACITQQVTEELHGRTEGGIFPSTWLSGGSSLHEPTALFHQQHSLSAS